MVCFTWSYLFLPFVLLISCFVISAHSDVPLPRPRGVSLAKASLYSPSKDFTCFDGTVTIPFSLVNDDYCDCFDGSDEPGTSACLNGVFHCTNVGHRSQNIPSSRVNDGICDCCDGTDEYAIPGSCPNTCEELGREARAEAERMVDLVKSGNLKRLEFIAKGSQRRNEMAEELTQLEKERNEAEGIKSEKEAIKNELEAKENEALKVYRDAEEKERQQKAEEEQLSVRNEALEHFKRFDSDGDGQLTVDEIQTRILFDKDKDGLVSIEEARYFLADQNMVDLETFITQSWPILKPLIMMEQGLFKPPQSEEETEHDIEGEDEGAELEGEENGDDVENVDVDAHQDDQLDEHEDEPKREYDEETQKLVNEATEARNQLTSAERTIREIESNIKNIKQNLEKDYGLQHEYATLDGQCFEYEDKEYVYRLCLFDKVTQKSKNGGHEVSLGNWGEWAHEKSSPYSVMKYINGMGCWNGPNRITTVHIQCGLETEVTSVTEPFRCEYKMEMTTPAACDVSLLNEPHAAHDEL